MSNSAANLLPAAAATGGGTAARLQHGTIARQSPFVSVHAAPACCIALRLCQALTPPQASCQAAAAGSAGSAGPGPWLGR
jgi:hypothetical protein